MQFIDLHAQQKRIREQIDININKVLEHGKYIMGSEVGELERKLGDFVEAKHAIACASGTDALLLALMAYNVGPGDAIFTSPFTFIATAEVISLLGATTVFADIDPITFNVDPSQLEKQIETVTNKHKQNLRPKGIIGVDIFGLPADYDAINQIAEKHGLFVIEDAAQSYGAEYNGKKACNLADIACTSFFPAKPLGCYGDGGMCFTNDDHLASVMKSLRVHGKGDHKYDNVRIGINGRLDTLQAAILLAKFDIFPEEIELRNKVAACYSRFLENVSGVISPKVPINCTSVWAQYSILAEDGNHRSQLQFKLKDEDIPTAVYYPKPLHRQPAFEDLGYQPDDFPVSDNYAERIFSLPMHPYLSEAEQERIVATLAA